MIYLIALLHAVPVLVIGLASNSRSRSISVAIFMALLGVITGNPAYMAIDLFAVGVALWFCLANVDKKAHLPTTTSHSPEWVSLVAAHNAKKFESQGSQTHDFSQEKNRGFLSNMRIISVYDKRIRAHGYEPRSLPLPDLHSTICSSFERRSEQLADMSQLTGKSRSAFIEASIEGAVDVLILCCVGPTVFKNKCGYNPSEIISGLAKTWIESGPEGSLELRIVDEINQAQYLNKEFFQAFQAERTRQEQAKTETNERLAAARLVRSIAIKVGMPASLNAKLEEENKRDTAVASTTIDYRKRWAAQRAMYKVAPLSIKIDIVRQAKVRGTEF